MGFVIIKDKEHKKLLDSLKNHPDFMGSIKLGGVDHKNLLDSLKPSRPKRKSKIPKRSP